MNSSRNTIKSALAVLSGASILALSLSQASALTLFAPTESAAAAQVELVGFHGSYGGWRHGGGYEGHGYWGHGYWNHGYWGSSYWGHMYPPYFPPRPCSIFGGTLHCPPV